MRVVRTIMRGLANGWYAVSDPSVLLLLGNGAAWVIMLSNWPCR
jgi:hypothetical protein